MGLQIAGLVPIFWRSKDTSLSPTGKLPVFSSALKLPSLNCSLYVLIESQIDRLIRFSLGRRRRPQYLGSARKRLIQIPDKVLDSICPKSTLINPDRKVDVECEEIETDDSLLCTDFLRVQK